MLFAEMLKNYHISEDWFNLYMEISILNYPPSTFTMIRTRLRSVQLRILVNYSLVSWNYMICCCSQQYGQLCTLFRQSYFFFLLSRLKAFGFLYIVITNRLHLQVSTVAPTNFWRRSFGGMSSGISFLYIWKNIAPVARLDLAFFTKKLISPAPNVNNTSNSLFFNSFINLKTHKVGYLYAYLHFFIL